MRIAVQLYMKGAETTFIGPVHVYALGFLQQDLKNVMDSNGYYSGITRLGIDKHMRFLWISIESV